MIKERIEAARSLFERFNTAASYVNLFEKDDDIPTHTGALKYLTVLRVNPHFDNEGNITNEDVFIIWDSPATRPHVSKMVEIKEVEPYRLECMTDNGHFISFEVADPVLQEDKVREWEKAQELRQDSRVAKTDRQNIEAAHEWAREWDK